MKITIPVEANAIQALVSPSFGRAPLFLQVDTDTQKAEFIVNTAMSNHGGAGIQAAQNVIDCGTQVLLTPRCGENAVTVLRAAHIGVYRAMEGTAEENIRAFLEGTLQPVGEADNSGINKLR